MTNFVKLNSLGLSSSKVSETHCLSCLLKEFLCMYFRHSCWHCPPCSLSAPRWPVWASAWSWMWQSAAPRWDAGDWTGLYQSVKLSVVFNCSSELTRSLLDTFLVLLFKLVDHWFHCTRLLSTLFLCSPVSHPLPSLPYPSSSTCIGWHLYCPHCAAGPLCAHTAPK